MVEQKSKNKSNKHYRYFIDKNLEESLFMDEHTFDEFDIVRGQKKVESSGLLSFFEN